MKFLSKTLHNQKGQGMMEYVLIAIVVGLIVLFIAAKFGGTLTNRFSAAKSTVDSTKIVSGGEASPSAEGN
jgi:Flp pilus assembly pilin Flp